MTNEQLAQLAADVKNKKPGAMLKLWEAVRRFVEKMAREWSIKSGGRQQVEDLTQAGFLTVIETAERFEPGQGYGYLHALSYALFKSFAEVSGTRGARRDALLYAESADAAAYREDPDGPTVAEMVKDEGAALAFLGVEYADFLSYCRGIINAALDTLTDRQATILRLHYLEGRTLTEAAGDLSTKQAASDTEERALRHLERGQYRQELRDCLTAFEDFRAYEYAARATSAGRYRQTGTSATESAATVKTGGMST